jgi:hypothetical protein
MTQFFLKHTKQLQIVHAIFSVFSFLKKKGYEITVQSVFLRFNFWINWLIFTKFGMNVMPLEARPSFYFHVMKSNNRDAWTHEMGTALAPLNVGF